MLPHRSDHAAEQLKKKFPATAYSKFPVPKEKQQKLKPQLVDCRYGSASYKAPAATVLDPNGKLCVTLTYGKLLSRSYKIAYTLLNKALSRVVGECCLKPGDRIALVYPNDDPINFVCAFYGCLQAGIVPVPIEVPLTRRDAGSQQIGFLLGSCGIQVGCRRLLSSCRCFLEAIYVNYLLIYFCLSVSDVPIHLSTLLFEKKN